MQRDRLQTTALRSAATPSPKRNFSAASAPTTSKRPAGAPSRSVNPRSCRTAPRKKSSSSNLMPCVRAARAPKTKVLRTCLYIDAWLSILTKSSAATESLLSGILIPAISSMPSSGVIRTSCWRCWRWPVRAAVCPSARRSCAQEELFRRVRAHDLEATRRGAEPLGQAEIVQGSSKKEEFFIETDPFRPSGEAAENKGSKDMFID